MTELPPPPPPVECDDEGMKVYIHDPLDNSEAYSKLERFSAIGALVTFVLMIAVGLNEMSMDGGSLTIPPAAKFEKLQMK